MSKKNKIKRPDRDPDHYSKRGVPYWWAPEWIRGTSADTMYFGGYREYPISDRMLNDGTTYTPCPNYSRIHPVKQNGDVELYMQSQRNNLTYIRGSIQQEFKRWHEDRQIDCILLGMDPDDILKKLGDE